MSKFSVRLFFSLVFIFHSLVFADNLKVLKTKYFDIIYAPQSEKTASLIYSYADQYAEEISGRLGKNPPWRMPVYISTESEALNGYFTFFPYQRIVIYDTTAEDGQLGNSYDSILNVFYHELTHAISLFYYFPALPISFIEGVAVLFESRGDQGRLNDPLFHHYLMQNKIDGTTPNWKQAAGHRDVYPGTFWAYLYGAGFASYIEKVYGKELYSKLWRSNFFIFPQSKTKNIFEKKLDVLWKDFTDSIYYPEEYLKPADFSSGKKSGFALTAQTVNGFACYDFNEKAVFFYGKDGTSRRLFYSSAKITDLNFSQDGKKLLVSNIIEKNGKIRQILSVFDVEKNSFLREECFSVRYAAFSSENEICAIKVKNQFSEIVLLDSALNEKEILFSAGPGFPYAQVYSIVFAGENKAAFIAANGLKRDILILDTRTKKIQKFTPQENLEAIRYLKSNTLPDGVTLAFSWSGPGKLYRMALFEMKTSVLKILEEDISGGVFQPIIIEENGKDKTAAYIGIHGKYNKLYKLNTSVLKEKRAVLMPAEIEKIPPLSIAPDSEHINPQRFYYSSWLWRVFPIPALSLPANLKDGSRCGFGISLYAKDPTELLSFSITPLFYAKPFFAQMNIEMALNVKPFIVKTEFHDENIDFRFRKTGFSAGFTSYFPLNRMNHNLSAGMEISANWFSPFTDALLKSKNLYGGKFTHTVFSDSVFLEYFFLKKRYRLGTYFFAEDKYGFSSALKLTHSTQIQAAINSFALQTKFSFFTPVIPFKMSLSGYYGYNCIFNPALGGFPLLNGSLMYTHPYLPVMPEYSGIGKKIISGRHNTGFGLDMSIMIFSYEIQTGSTFLPIFYNRINFELGYNSVFNFARHENSNLKTYFQSAYGKVFLDISGAAKLGVRYAHPLEKEAVKTIGRFSLLFDLVL